MATTKKNTSSKPKTTKKKVVKEPIEVLEDEVSIEDFTNQEKEAIIKEIKNDKIDNNRNPITLPFTILSLIVYIAFVVSSIVSDKEIINDYVKLGSYAVILLLLIMFIIISYRSVSKNVKYSIIGSILIILLCVYKILNIFGYLNVNNALYVDNFYNKELALVYSWNSDKNLKINELYEYSDIIPINHIIAQDVDSSNKIDDVQEINLIISLGPDYNKEVIVPSFVGWNFDKVISYLEENHLNNVNISFVESEKEPNSVINQEGSGTRKRSDLIKLTFAQGTIEEVEIPNFKEKSLLYATSWLLKHGFKYEITYENNDNIVKNYVISNNYVGEVKDPSEDKIDLVVSKGKLIIIPDFSKMNQDEINEWMMDNNIKVNYKEVYDDKTSLGDIIDSSINKDEEIEAGSSVTLTISLGKKSMIEVVDVDKFIEWAKENDISYQVNYEFSDSVKKGGIISTSHQEGQAIKDEDTVVVTVSKGSSIKVPNFVGSSKTNIQTKCNSLGLSCSFKYGGNTESTSKDIAIKQSQKSGAIVASGTNIIITLSSGIYEKVTVPSFVGSMKSAIQTKCNSLGITCKFVYESSYSSTKKDTCTKQSTTGKVNKGSTITITLSKGPAPTYTFIIDANQLSSGNPEATKKTLQNKLTKNYPDVKFVFSFVKANSGIGYLAPSSQIKVGSNTVTAGKTYKVIINSN